MKRKTKLIVFLIVCAIFVAASPALAQEPVPTPSDDEVNAIAKNMYCPICENIPLDVCGTQACAQWRAEIKDKLIQGWTEEEIHDHFVLKYGDRVLAEPPRRGINWLIYIVPPVAIVIGVVFLVRGYQTWRKPIEETVDETPQKPEKKQDDYISRLEEEISKRK